MLVFLQRASALFSVVFVLGAWENRQTDLGKSEHEHRNLRHPQRGPLTLKPPGLNPNRLKLS